MSWPLLNVPFERREQKTTVEAPGCTSLARERGRAYSGSIELPVSPGKGPKTCLLPQIYYRSMELLTGTRSCSSAVALHKQPLWQLCAGRSSGQMGGSVEDAPLRPAPGQQVASSSIARGPAEAQESPRAAIKLANVLPSSGKA